MGIRTVTRDPVNAPSKDMSTPRLRRPSLSSLFSVALLGVALLGIGIAGGVRIVSVLGDQDRQINAAISRHYAEQRQRVRMATMEIARQIRTDRISIRQKVHEVLKSRVAEAIGTATHLYETYKETMPLDDLKSLVRETLRGIRFNNGRGYYFAVALNGIHELHPLSPKFEGTDVLHDQNLKSRELTRKLLGIVRASGQGFYYYSWPHPNHEYNKDFDKITFVSEFKPFKWVIGTGEYIADIEDEIKESALDTISQINIPQVDDVFATRWDGMSLAGRSAGTNILALKDVNNAPFVQDSIALAKEGGGFVEYNLGDDSPVGSGRRLSYIHGIPAWQWYVGTSVDMDTVNMDLVAIHRSVSERVTQTIRQTALLMLVTAIIAFGLVWWARVQLRRNIGVFLSFFQDASRSATSINPRAISFSEFAHLARSANAMLEALERTKAHLRDSQQSFELTIKGSGDGIWLYDVALGQAWMSPRCTEILGYTLSEIPNTFDSHMSLIHPDDRDTVRKAFEAHINADVPFDLEYRLHTKSGSYIWVRSHAGALRDSTGKAIRIGGTTANITDRREVQERLRRNKLLLESVLENSPALIYAKDVFGHYLFVNKGWERQFTISRAQALGKTDLDLFPTEIAHRLRDQDLTVIATNQPLEQEETLRSLGAPADADAVLMSRKVPLLNTLGQAEGVCGIATDISERKRMERELSARITELGEARRVTLETLDDLREERKRADALRERAEAANRSKSAFLAAMSHEIRTPMNGVVGMIDLLRETPLSDNQKSMMNTVRESSLSLLQIIDDILDHSKIEAGRLTLESIPISIRDTLEGVAEALRITADKKSVCLSLFIDPDIPPRVLSDQVRLRQILFNLIGNAIKFTQTQDTGKGWVRMRAERRPPSDTGETRVAFIIQDNGIGMTPQTLSRLFQPFTQADQSTTRRFGGTGLGLSICQTLTGMMGGTITVDSAEGEGTLFTVTLPFSEVANAPTEEPDLSGLSIGLLVRNEDDSTTLRRYCIAQGATVMRMTALGDVALVADRLDILVIGEAWGQAAQTSTAARVRTLTSSVRFVMLSADRAAPRGMIAPDTLAVECNPIRRSTVLQAIAVAAGRASPDLTDGGDTLGDSTRVQPAPTVEAARADGHLILVAEDNIINQDVIRRQINQLGYACEVAENGHDALEMIKKTRYAMLLTDCHMPRMDGFALTEAIRIQEQEVEDGTRLPIVAITANALHGEADRCLSAGMDDYLAKPLEMRRLKAMLTKWMPDQAMGGPLEKDSALPSMETAVQQDPDTVTAPVSPSESAPVDTKALTTVFGDDEATISEVLNDFVAPARDIVAELDAAVTNGQAQAAAQAAHKLKSAARAIGANTLADLCQGIETAGKQGNMTAVTAMAPRLDPTLAAVAAYVAERYSAPPPHIVTADAADTAAATEGPANPSSTMDTPQPSVQQPSSPQHHDDTDGR